MVGRCAARAANVQPSIAAKRVSPRLLTHRSNSFAALQSGPAHHQRMARPRPPRHDGRLRTARYRGEGESNRLRWLGRPYRNRTCRGRMTPKEWHTSERCRGGIASCAQELRVGPVSATRYGSESASRRTAHFGAFPAQSARKLPLRPEVHELVSQPSGISLCVHTGHGIFSSRGRRPTRNRECPHLAPHSEAPARYALAAPPRCAPNVIPASAPRRPSVSSTRQRGPAGPVAGTAWHA